LELDAGELRKAATALKSEESMTQVKMTQKKRLWEKVAMSAIRNDDSVNALELRRAIDLFFGTEAMDAGRKEDEARVSAIQRVAHSRLAGMPERKSRLDVRDAFQGKDEEKIGEMGHELSVIEDVMEEADEHDGDLVDVDAGVVDDMVVV
jgi:hypothetical protein